MAADHYDQLQEAIERFCARPRSEAGAGAEPADKLPRLRHLCDLLEMEFCKLAGDLSQIGRAEIRGTRSPIAWIRHNCHMSGHAAADRVRVGKELHRLPDSERAVASGQIGFSHLSLIAQTARALGQSPTAHRFCEHILLDSAKALTVSRFRNFCQQIRRDDDQGGPTGEPVDGNETNHFELASRKDGRLAARGTFDAAAGAVVRTALEPLARRTGRGDHRSRGRRWADALVAICSQAVDTGPAGTDVAAGPPRCTWNAHSQRCPWPEGGWHLVRTADGRLVAIPPPIPGPRPPTRGPGQPRAA